jgi:hypothetical protein
VQLALPFELDDPHNAYMVEYRKPGDHPEFFRIALPSGTSRESHIRLDREGHFWHEGALVEHAALSRAMHKWIARHPDDHRYILTNGYDWTYFQVDDVPFIVVSLSISPTQIVLHLSDETSEPLRVHSLRIGPEHALYAVVKDGNFEARFSRFAQTSLAPVLEETPDGALVIVIGAERFVLPST